MENKSVTVKPAGEGTEMKTMRGSTTGVPKPEASLSPLPPIPEGEESGGAGESRGAANGEEPVNGNEMINDQPMPMNGEENGEKRLVRLHFWLKANMSICCCGRNSKKKWKWCPSIRNAHAALEVLPAFKPKSEEGVFKPVTTYLSWGFPDQDNSPLSDETFGRLYDSAVNNPTTNARSAYTLLTHDKDNYRSMKNGVYVVYEYTPGIDNTTYQRLKNHIVTLVQPSGVPEIKYIECWDDDEKNYEHKISVPQPHLAPAYIYDGTWPGKDNRANCVIAAENSLKIINAPIKPLKEAIRLTAIHYIFFAIGIGINVVDIGVHIYRCTKTDEINEEAAELGATAFLTILFAVLNFSDYTTCCPSPHEQFLNKNQKLEDRSCVENCHTMKHDSIKPFSKFTMSLIVGLTLFSYSFVSFFVPVRGLIDPLITLGVTAGASLLGFFLPCLVLSCCSKTHEPSKCCQIKTKSRWGIDRMDLVGKFSLSFSLAVHAFFAMADHFRDEEFHSPSGGLLGVFIAVAVLISVGMAVIKVSRELSLGCSSIIRPCSNPRSLFRQVFYHENFKLVHAGPSAETVTSNPAAANRV